VEDRGFNPAARPQTPQTYPPWRARHTSHSEISNFKFEVGLPAGNPQNKSRRMKRESVPPAPNRAYSDRADKIIQSAYQQSRQLRIAFRLWQ
jgi:hypothetical protein